MVDRRKVAVSYAWAEEKDGEHARVVKKFCDDLQANGVEVVRDSSVLKYGDRFELFMREEIGKAGVLCVFLTESYLRSANCMYELLVAWKWAYGNPDEFRQRVRIWAMFSHRRYAKLAGRATVLAHWKKESAKQTKALNKHVPHVSSDSNEEVRHVIEIAANIDGMLAHAMKSLSPDTYEEFRDWILGEVGPGSVGDQLQDVFPNVVKEINELITDSEPVREMLKAACSALLDGKKLSGNAIQELQRSPEVLVDAFKGVHRHLQRTLPKDLKVRSAIRKVVGGLLTLSTNINWVLEHRRQLHAAIPVPGRGESGANRNPDNGSQFQYSWLELCVSALADSHVRVERVFAASHDENGKRLPGWEQVQEVPGTQFARDLIRQLLIRHFLGEHIEVPDSDDVKVRREFDGAFREVVAAMKAAMEERDPFHAAGPGWNSDKVRRHVREDLQLQDLLLFSSPTGDPEAFLPGHAAKVIQLYRIFDLLEG